MLFKGEHSSACALCIHASVTVDDQETSHIFCRGNEVEPDGSCRRFRYDPLKRGSDKPLKLKNDYDPEDFKL